MEKLKIKLLAWIQRVFCATLLLCCFAVAASAQNQPAAANATKQPAAETKVPLPDTVLADEKLSLEWLNLRLNARLARETVARMRAEAAAIESQIAEIDKQTDGKLQELRQKASVPTDWQGEIRGNQVVFTRPPAVQTAGTTTPGTPPKKDKP